MGIRVKEPHAPVLSHGDMSCRSKSPDFERMEIGMEYSVGDIVQLKKKHPCGSSEWEILRVGADFRLKCLGCQHQIMVARKLVEKNTKNLRKGL